MLTNSLEFFDQARLHTCDPVSIELMHVLFDVFQNLIVLSAVPPPLARIPCYLKMITCCGLQAIALTAAV